MKKIERIIIARTDKIGDVILSIPSIFMLRKMFPLADIAVFVRGYTYDIVKNLPYISRIIKIDDYSKKDLLSKVEYFNADVFIALYSDDFVSELAKKSNAKIKIGPYSKLKSFFTYNRGVVQKRSRSIKNEADYNLDLVKKLDPIRYENGFEINTDIILDDDCRSVAKKYFEQEKIVGKVLVVNPYSGDSAKNLTDEQYLKIIKRVLDEKGNLHVIVSVNVRDEEKINKLLKNTIESRLHIFSNSAGILNLAGIIEKADVYFGSSTGPTHIAGALGKKVLAIYPNKKTQSPTRWGIFADNKGVEYFIPDQNNKNENYENKTFDNFTQEMEDKIVGMILAKL
ncbi:MAG: glycosyltransferase family 9 protein [Fusobacteriaceae bacterium]